MQLKNYIEKHIIMKIGCGEYNDIIIDDPEEFVCFLQTTPYRIYSILWFEYLPISKKNSALGGGGPIDLKKPCMYWSEIYYLWQVFEPSTTAENVSQYLKEIKSKYPSHDIYPAFTLSLR